MRALGDLIRTYSKSADDLDQMAAVMMGTSPRSIGFCAIWESISSSSSSMMGLPPPVLAASGFSAKSAFAFAFRFLVYTQQG